MACDEIAGLRLALMNLLGGDRRNERQHEEAELGDALRREGPIKSLAAARTLVEITREPNPVWHECEHGRVTSQTEVISLNVFSANLHDAP